MVERLRIEYARILARKRLTGKQGQSDPAIPAIFDVFDFWRLLQQK
jgi:hypothetical protein